MLLSILICHLTNRKLLLERLMKCLQPQVDKVNENGAVVEVLIEEDQGQKTTGEKRNVLLDRATGQYTCYVDDDDTVSPQYCDLILKALEEKPDCVSLKGLLFRLGHTPRNFSHSIKHGIEWREEKFIYLRPPNHLNTVRRELALQVKFPLIVIGEDKDYSTRLFPLLKTETEVVPELYYYHTR